MLSKSLIIAFAALATQALAAPTTTSTTTLVLPSPSQVIEAGDNNEINAFDIPFAIHAYNYSNTRIAISTYGWVAVIPPVRPPVQSGLVGSNNIPLPQPNGTGLQGLPPTTFCALWDDLATTAGTNQGDYYEAEGVAPDRKISFEWLTTHDGDPAQHYHFLVVFKEAKPGWVRYRYLDISDKGRSATVGLQSIQAHNFSQYSFDKPMIKSGLELTFNVRENVFEVSKEPGCE